MEPRIILGHLYRCKKSVIGNNGKAFFKKGESYKCNEEYPYPAQGSDTAKYACGFITNEFGDSHAWPYDPQRHCFCHDRWTDYFEELNSKEN